VSRDEELKLVTMTREEKLDYDLMNLRVEAAAIRRDLIALGAVVHELATKTSEAILAITEHLEKP